MQPPIVMKSTATLPSKSPKKEANLRFNRLLPALGYVSHDFISTSFENQTESGKSWQTSKPNRILQGIEPYQYLTEIASLKQAPPAKLSATNFSPAISNKLSRASLHSNSTKDLSQV
jgi:hypothetical protein